MPNLGTCKALMKTSKRYFYDEIRQRDRDAFDLSKRTGCSFSEAWKALLPEDPKRPANRPALLFDDPLEPKP